MTMESIRLVKQISPVQAIEYYTHQSPQHGKYLCVFHHDRHPSMTVKGTHWQCWSCGEHGDVIAFVQKYFNISFPDAVHKLANDFNIPLAEPKPPADPLDKLCRIIQAESRECNREEIQSYRLTIDQDIDKLVTAHRVLAQHGADDETLRRYADEIDELMRYRQTI